MFKISLFTQVALVLAFGLGFPEFAHSQSPLQCSEIYEVSEAQALPPHPMSSAVQKLVIKKEMVLEFLDVFTGQTQRQVQKLGRQIEKIVEAFVRDQDLSESTINRLIELNEKMEAYALRIEERAPLLNTDPLRLRRLLFIREPIDPKYVYYAKDLPGFGRVDIHFSREVADFFNQTGPPRDTVFPAIFRGRVGNRGQDGIKNFTDTIIRPPDAREWALMELKRIGGGEARVMIMQTEGHLFFFKVFTNHNRVEYVNKENVPQLFFQSQFYQDWAASQ